MKCPYCASEISDEAGVCPCCTRDLYPFKPLLARIAALEEKVAAFAELEKRSAESAAMDTPSHAGGLHPDESGPAAPLTARTLFPLLLAVLALLLLGHLLITQIWDAPEWVLYAVSIVIPLAPGYLLTRRYGCTLLAATAAGFLLAAAAVLGMSASTALLDDVPFLPHDAREWKELANFWLGIGFAYTAGAILGQVMSSRAAAEIQMIKRLANPSLAKILDVDSAQKSMERLDHFAKTMLAFSATAAAAYSGLGRFVGN